MKPGSADIMAIPDSWGEWKKGRTIIRHDRNDRTITPITIGLIELSFLSIDFSHFCGFSIVVKNAQSEIACFFMNCWFWGGK